MKFFKKYYHWIIILILIISFCVHWFVSKSNEYSEYYKEVLKLEIGESFKPLEKKGIDLGVIYITHKSKYWISYMIKAPRIYDLDRIWITLRNDSLVDFMYYE